MFCRKCGKELTDGAAFCQFCGEKQTAEDPEEEEKEGAKTGENSKSSDRKLYLAGAAIGILIIVAIGLVKVLGAGSRDGEVVLTEAEDLEQGEEIEMKEEAPAEETEPAISEEPAEEQEETEAEIEEDAAAETEETVQVTEKPLASYLKVESRLDADQYAEYWFDEDGDLVKCVESQADNKKEDNIQYLTDADGNKICADREGQQKVLISANVMYSALPHRENLWNTKHLVSRIDHTDESDSSWNRCWQFIYDERCRLIEANDTFMDYTSVYTFDYQENAGQLTMLCTDANFGTQSQGTLILDDAGRILEHSSTNEDGGWREIYEYDENGNVVRSAYENNTDNVYTSTIDYEYDANGRLIRSGNGDSSETIWEYDENGNKIKYQSYNRNTMWEYDEEGRLALATSYSYQGIEGTELKEYITKYQYDEQGRLSEILENDRTILTISYNGAGMPSKIWSDSYAEIEEGLVYGLMPENILWESIGQPVKKYYNDQLIRNAEVTIEY